MKTRRVVERMCISCRHVRPKTELLRIVRDPEGALHIDATGKAPGRGAYVCKNRDCFEQAATQRRFDRALLTTVAPETIEQWRAEISW